MTYTIIAKGLIDNLNAREGLLEHAAYERSHYTHWLFWGRFATEEEARKAMVLFHPEREPKVVPLDAVDTFLALLEPPK